jgi:hypothetical protein
MTNQYPPTMAERNPAGDIHIQPEDIADYSQTPGTRERYTAEGLKKAAAMGLVSLTPEDFGATPDSG